MYARIGGGEFRPQQVQHHINKHVANQVTNNHHKTSTFSITDTSVRHHMCRNCAPKFVPKFVPKVAPKLCRNVCRIVCRIVGRILCRPHEHPNFKQNKEENKQNEFRHKFRHNFGANLGPQFGAQFGTQLRVGEPSWASLGVWGCEFVGPLADVGGRSCGFPAWSLLGPRRCHQTNILVGYLVRGIRGVPGAR